MKQQKQHINLFNYYHLSARQSMGLYKKIKKYIFYSLFAFLLCVIGLQLTGLEFKKQIESLDREQEIILADTINTRNSDAGIEELVIKKQLIQEYLKDDVQFNTYYRLVQSYVADNAGAQLNKFTLDKDRKTEIAVDFVAYEDYRTFLQKLENDKFVANFDELSIAPLQWDSQSADQYSVMFIGTFKEINEKKI